jgi:mono/diheme cytochrome c family protein
MKIHTHKNDLNVIFIFTLLTFFQPTKLLASHNEPNKNQSESYEYATLNQGWTEDERKDFYNTSQGSQLIPYSWFLALEQKNSSSNNIRLFLDPEHIKVLGYIPQNKTPGINPDGLPVGFVKDNAAESLVEEVLIEDNLPSQAKSSPREYQVWLGLTCAACHTSELRVNNQIIRIDGGPPLSDFQSLMQSLSDAVDETLKDNAKLTRFAKNVLPQGGYNAKEEQRLKEELKAYQVSINDYVDINYGGLITPYGYGRLDAFGAILNRVTSSFIDIKANAKPANAPVSYPFLWNVSQMSWVQWNGSANNHIERNIGEVAGVFGHVIVKTDNKKEQFKSSAKIMNLYHLEKLVEKLDSPKWGNPLPPIDNKKADAGKILFAKICAGCHGIRDENGQFPMTDPNALGKQFIKIIMIGLNKIKTDPLMANNFINPAMDVDPGVIREHLPAPFQSLEKVPRAAILSTVVDKIIEKQYTSLKPDENQRNELSGFHISPDRGGPPPPNLRAYKARPLNGVWATAPYLHNGSVSSLYEILLPESRRKKSFVIGGNIFNTKDIGFDTDENGNSFEFRTIDDQGKPIPGNGNGGHSGKGHTEYRTNDGQWREFSDTERYQIIEYLKTL